MPQTQSDTPYHQNTAAWIFAPKYTEVRDIKPGTIPVGAVVDRTNLYYDGANSVETLPTKGLVTASSRQLTAYPATWQSSYAAFDAIGNAVRASVASPVRPEDVTPASPPSGATYGWLPTGAGAPAYSTMQYDTTQKVFPIRATNPLGHITDTAYDIVLGKPLTVTGPHKGNVNAAGVAKRELRYDAFGRLDKVWDSLDSETTPTKTFSYRWSTLPNSTSVSQKSTDAGAYRTSTSCMDGFGRVIATHEPYAADAANITLSQYDDRGMLAAESRPSSYDALPECMAAADFVTMTPALFDRTIYAYDPLGQVTTTQQLAGLGQDASTSVSTTDGQTTTICSDKAAGEKSITRQIRNAAARTLTVLEPAQVSATCSAIPSWYTTTYRYDAEGQLIQVVDHGGNVTNVSYDMAGRKVQMVDPDMGTWDYTYNVAGSLATQRDNRTPEVTTTLAYDVLERLTEKSYSDTGTPPVYFKYDDYPTEAPCSNDITALGRQTRMLDGVATDQRQLSCFDVRGREYQTRRRIDSTDYDINREFNRLGQVKKLTYPHDGTAREEVSYAFDSVGTMTGMSSSYGETFLSGMTNTAWGAPLSMTLGTTPAQTTSYEYDYRGSVERIRTGTTSTAVQDLTLTYDLAGNVSSVVDAPASETSTYSYDQLNRLTGMQLNSASAAAYAYDPIGNMTSKREGVGATALALAYPSGSNPARPHAVTSTSGAQSLSLSYDGNGNLSTQGSSSYAFDAENRLKTRAVGSGSVTYTYGGAGELLKRTNSADGSTVTYVGGTFEKTQSGAVTKYYGASGRSVATRAGGGVRFMLADHLGGTTTEISATASVVCATKFWPYGAARSSSGTGCSDQKFTGQRDEAGDAALGLYNYKARFYSTTTGRFVSADPTTTDGLNRYQYVRGNPVLHTDASGYGVTGGGGRREGACPASRPRCFEDASGPVGGAGAPDPVVERCDVACQEAKIAHQAVVDGMRAGAAIAGAHAAVAINNANAQAWADAGTLTSRPYVAETQGSGGPIGRLWNKVAGVKSDVASIGIEVSLCVVACVTVTGGVVSTDSGSRLFGSVSGSGSIGIGVNGTLVGTAGNQRNGASGFEGFSGGSFVWQACGAGEVLVGCAEGAHNRQYDGVGFAGGVGANFALNPIPSINPSAGGSYTYVAPWGF